MADTQSKEYRLLCVILVLQIILVVLVAFSLVLYRLAPLPVVAQTVTYTPVESVPGNAPLLVLNRLDWGALDETNWTVPVQIEVTLKEATEETTALVQLGDQTAALKREDLRLYGTLVVPLFTEQTPLEVVVQDGETKRLETIGDYPGWQAYLLRRGNLFFDTMEGWGYLKYNLIKEKMECKGRLAAAASLTGSAWPVSALVIMEMNGQEKARQELFWEDAEAVPLYGEEYPVEMRGEEVRWQADLALSAQSVVTLRGQIVDNHGLIYEYSPQVIYSMYGQDSQQTTPYDGELLRILAPDGTVLYE